MPFLRIIRDKRGYETTYLMHWYREGHRQRSRILYVFRTPGGVRVGRDAMEPEVLRSIEAQYPDIEFDWKAVVENKQVVEPAAVDLRRPRKRRRPEDEAGPSAVPAVASAAPAAEPASRPEAGTLAQPARPPIPSAIQGSTPDEQIAFLTTWYPAVRERIPHRTTDAVRQEVLLALAERLNPATWTDADQIAAGLVQAAEALERLSHVFSKRRRRPRRSSAGSGRPESIEGRSARPSPAAPPDATPAQDAAEAPPESPSDPPSDPQSDQ